MGLQRVIQTFCWDPGMGFDPRAGSVISDDAKIRIDPEDFVVKLRVDESTFRYPIDVDLNVRSWTVAPEKVDALEVLEVIGETPEGTSVGLRLFDGTEQWWWDGGAWGSSPGAGEWNTEAEVNANLATYDVSATREFGVVVNLTTTDDKVTPTVTAVKVLWNGSFSWLEDLLVDSLVGMFQDELTFEVDVGLPPLPSTSASIDLDDYVDDASGDLGYIDAVAVYDYDADLDRKVNLLTSYDAGTKVLSLSPSAPAGNRLILRMRAMVSAAWDTHRDFEPIGKLPQVILRNAETVSSAPYPSSFGGGIVRRDAGTGVEVPPPYRMTFRVEAEVRTDRNAREQAAVVEDFLGLLHGGPASEAGPFLRRRAVGDRVRLLAIDEYRARDIDLDDGDVASHTVEFLIQNVSIQLKPAVDTYAVSALKLKYANVDGRRRQQALSDGAPVPHTTFEEFETS